MFNIADIIVIALVLIAAFLGYKKGFIKTVFGMLAFFIAIAITFACYKPVMNLIKEKTGFEGWLTEYLSNINLNKEDDTDSSKEDEEKGYLENMPQIVIDTIGLEEIKTNAKNAVIEKIVNFAEKLLAIVLVYLAARIVLFILVLVLNSIAKLPVLKQFNEILGLVFGIILGFFRVYVICAIFTLIGSLPAMEGILGIVNNSLIAHMFYNNNILLKLLF